MAQRRTDRSRRRLGRGLDSLISTPVQIETKPEQSADQAVSMEVAASTESAPVHSGGGGVQMIPIEQIHANPDQPRKHFDEEALQSLAASIRSAGLMQPVVVRPSSTVSGGYQLVVGERRWRAAQLVGLSPMPAIVQELDDQTAMAWALIENLQREDLNPIERAEAFRQLIDEHGLTHQELAEQVGLNRSSVTNFLRLLELDETSQTALRTEQLTVGHAKVLLAITNITQRRHLAQAAIGQGWSVRALEQRISGLTNRSKAGALVGSVTRDPHLEDLQRQLGEHLGTKVAITSGKKKGTGRLTIDFYSLDQFDGLMERLGFESN